MGFVKNLLIVGSTYQLIESGDNNATGTAFFRSPDVSGEGADTNSEYTGELHITKFDPVHQIVSGTFWFDVQHPVTGERVEIREGRFDAVYGM